MGNKQARWNPKLKKALARIAPSITFSVEYTRDPK